MGSPYERQKGDYFHFEIRILVSWTHSFKYTGENLIFLLTKFFPLKGGSDFGAIRYSAGSLHFKDGEIDLLA